ncbi:MAG: dual specificity protein phosphatase family protein [Candidatus Hermodarchaeota archaeon]
MTEITQIHERLYISGQFSVEKMESTFRELQIVAIVNLLNDYSYEPPSGIVYLWSGFRDRSYIPHQQLEEILTFIAENIKKGAVLVHCGSGVSRSGGIICARLLVENPNWEWDDAIWFTKKKRRIAPAPLIKESILDYFEQKEGQRREKPKLKKKKTP